MGKTHSKFTFTDFLKDERFLSWQLSGTEEEELFWTDFSNHCSESQRIEFEKAIRAAHSIKLNDNKLSPEKATVLFSRIKQSINHKKRIRSSQKILVLGIAAGVAILFGISFFFFHSGMKNIDDTALEAMIPDSRDTIREESSKDIRLILSGNETVILDNDVKIKYDSSGNLTASTEEQDISKSVEKHKQLSLNKLIVPKGKRSTLELADGTRVWINSGSVLQFPSVFNDKYREILAEGEIYIEVLKDAGKPFKVKTPRFEVQVLGTRFNVSAYQEDKTQSVVLVSGSVSVKTKSDKEFRLIPDQMLNIAGDISEIKTVDVYDYISWKDGLLQFKSTSLDQITSAISRYFDVQITCSPEPGRMKCSGKLVLFDDLNTVLSTLKEIFPVDFIRDGNEIRIISKT
jgi:hypothetical protein